MDNKIIELSKYRLEEARETLQVAKDCYYNKHYKDSINRSYYAVFYAIKAVLALEEVDFKRHKDVVAYFNHAYIATNILPKDIGRRISNLKQKREQSDYDDFFVASSEEAYKQIETANMTIEVICNYLARI